MERQALMPTIEQSRTMEPGTSAVQVQASGEPRGTKRPREQNEPQVEISSRRSGNHASESSGNASLLPEWAPIAQYNGPDFGFDALQFDIQPGEDQILNALDLNHTGLFDDMGWQDFSSG
ncbi:hypothetical protein TruAng_002670 [Truncatella angustata]|nr:hypothetical protein TruAng_002670 [Truncatella angustata]